MSSIPDTPDTIEDDTYRITNDQRMLLTTPSVYIDLHPFTDPDQHACLLRELRDGLILPRHHVIDLVKRILDGHELIDEEAVIGGSLVMALENDYLIERVNKSANLNFRPDIKRAAVYLMEAKGVYKIGFSTQLEKRRKAIQSKEKATVTVVHAREVDRPYVLEQQLHKRFSDQRLHGEWFALAGFDLDKAITLMDSWEGGK